MIVKPKLHLLNMGETGSGKDTFALTFPKPMIVHFFDPRGKDLPYLRKHPAFLNEAEPVDDGLKDHSLGTYRDVQRPDGLVRIYYWYSLSPLKPDAYSRFLAFMGEFHKEQDAWRTMVLSSTTFMELEARKWHQYTLNPDAKDGRQWFGGSTDLLEEMVMMRFAGLDMNVVTITHIDEEKDELHGEIVRNPSLPGRLRKRLACAYGEHYRSFVQRGDAGELVYQLQTQNNGIYAAQSQIRAPNPCYPHYDSLWENWK